MDMRQQQLGLVGWIVLHWNKHCHLEVVGDSHQWEVIVAVGAVERAGVEPGAGEGERTIQMRIIFLSISITQMFKLAYAARLADSPCRRHDQFSQLLRTVTFKGLAQIICRQVFDGAIQVCTAATHQSKAESKRSDVRQLTSNELF
jgi:hypothetical protein